MTTPEQPYVRYATAPSTAGEEHGLVATLTLDSPHNRNALSRRLVTELLDALDAAAADEAVKVVVLASSGRVFCSGADLSEAARVPMAEGARAIVELQRRVLAHPRPVVVALGGPVRAGGTGLVAAADVVVAAPGATFALTEVKLGLAPAAISLTVLPRLAPRAASWAALSGAPFDAAQAYDWGLVTQVLPEGTGAEELAAAVDAVAAELATGSGQGLAETKRLLNADLLDRVAARGDDLAELSSRLFGSDEARAAMTAFLSRGR